ncbi:SDR family oxidoreductase [Pseudonocardia ailaonensis]|uniref:SDR family oxidoreductase n=1 Tax=Pseudonocardia ailaonensis TaxID=367279 RepID=A0ABN2N975_9PSEU
MRYLITGATGYIGGRLAPRLLAEGTGEVRCLVRDPGKLRDVPWARDAEIVKGDLLDPDSVRAACEDVDVVYFLVHSLSDKGFAATDRRVALVLAEAAREAGVQRIVYLGGLHPDGPLSEHLESRAEVGEILLRSGVPTAALQAAVILGSGSASFEMLRYLTERLPVMLTPSWVRNRVQPIAVRDVLRYLIAAAGLPPEVNRTFDIGGPDVLTYLDMMQRYAAVAGLPRRRILSAPVLTPRLSAHWVNVVTPVPRGIAAPLIESLVHEVVCREHDILEYAPGECLGYEKAVELALARIGEGEVETHWSGAAVEGAPSDPLPSDPDWAGGTVYTDDREQRCAAAPEDLWRVVTGIGGERGWYSFPLAWSVRGWLDRLAGGVGLARGRRNPDQLLVGDALDWWRVEELEPGRLLRLRAEMKVPGLAWLEMGVAPDPAGSRYTQRAVFVPHGLAGHLYWWSVAPFHGIVFGGMVRNITGTAERARI